MKVVVRRVVHVGLTGRHRVKHFKRANQLARCFFVDGQVPSDISLTMLFRYVPRHPERRKPRGQDVTIVSVACLGRKLVRPALSRLQLCRQVQMSSENERRSIRISSQMYDARQQIARSRADRFKCRN